MVSFARLLCLGLFVACPFPAFAMDDTPQNRAQEAARYLQAVPPEDAAAGMVTNIAQSLPEQQQKAFAAAMQKNLNAAALKAAAQAGLVKVFSADELKALADFYGSPLGKSAMAKMGAYMAETAPAIEKEVDAAAGKAEKETGIKLEAKQ
jgi:hypothetical protein